MCCGDTAHYQKKSAMSADRKGTSEPWSLTPVQHYHHSVRSNQRIWWAMVGPTSSYSSLEIKISGNREREATIDPPIQAEYLRSGGTTTSIFVSEGAMAVSSLVIRSPIPSNLVFPPLMTTLAYRSSRMFISHLAMDWKIKSWTPMGSFPTKFGWKSASGQRKRSVQTVTLLPSGSSQVISMSDDSVAALHS